MAPNNRFLAALSEECRTLLVNRCTPVSLPLKTSLYSPNELPEYAYFMTSGVASVVTETIDGGTAEVGLIGYEGVAGTFHLLGPAPVPTNCFIQIAGTGLRIPFSELRKAFRSSNEIHERVLELVQQQALTLAQVAGCHRLHEAEERLARWLLMAQDRTQSDVLHLTQEFLGMMLGANRTTVTVVAGAMQRSGLIEYSRGEVKILNRENLEAAACDCYQVAKKLYDGLYRNAVSNV